jgi:hypothetical protein
MVLDVAAVAKGGVACPVNCGDRDILLCRFPGVDDDGNGDDNMVDVVVVVVVIAVDAAASCRGEVFPSVLFSSVDESLDKRFFASCTLALVPFPSVPSWSRISSSPKTGYFNCCVFSSCDDVI